MRILALASLRLHLFVIFFLLLCFSCSRATATTVPRKSICTFFTNCSSCLGNEDCGWCDGDRRCYNASTSVFTNCTCKYSNSSCPANCGALATCQQCNNTDGCAWCAISGTCVPVNSEDELCRSSVCEDQLQCLKAPFIPYQNCPSSNCSLLSSCLECTSHSCFWCGKRQQCIEASVGENPTACGALDCGASSDFDCWKGSPTECPEMNCATLDTCFDCTSAGCYWCGQTQSCMEASVDTPATPCNDYCPLGNCWKNDTSQCAVKGSNGVRCSSFNGNCQLCTSYPACGFCADTQQCYEASDDGTPCLPCDKWAHGSCDSLCAPHGSSCVACTAAAPLCGFCAGYPNPSNPSLYLSTCLTASPSGLGPFSNISCALWHGAASSCPNCSLHEFDCDTCLNADGCGWCTRATGDRCLEGSPQHSYFSNECEAELGVWNGTTCTDIRCPATENGACNDHGVCDRTTGLCACSGDWLGPACTCSPKVCRHGSCDPLLGTCNCTEHYYGPDCNIYCNASSTCSGNGFCLDTGECSCSTGWFGTTCNTPCTGAANCSSHGTCCAVIGDCTSGVCDCNPTWEGPQCATLNCNNAIDCTSCAFNEQDCVWCEHRNLCMQISDAPSGCTATNASQCPSSCTALAQSECLDGTHCHCAWCGTAGGNGRCYWFAHDTAPNNEDCYLLYKCTKPLGLSTELFVALLSGAGGVVLLALLVAGYFICRISPEDRGYREIAEEEDVLRQQRAN